MVEAPLSQRTAVTVPTTVTTWRKSLTSNIAVSPSSSPSIKQLENELSRGLLFNDRDGEEAVIVGFIDLSKSIIQTLPVTGNSELLLLDNNSKNLTDESNTPPDIHTFIKIMKKSLSKEAIYKDYEYHVDEYLIKEPLNESIGQYLVAVADVHVGALSVVGNNFVTPTFVYTHNFEKAVQSGDFIIGNVHQFKPFFVLKMVSNVVCYMKDLEAEREYLAKVSHKKCNGQSVSPSQTPDGMFYITGLRVLSEDEVRLIQSNCCDLKEITLQQANLYIRDVYIAVTRLEKSTRSKSIKKHTLELEGSIDEDCSGTNPHFTLTVTLNEEQIEQVIRSKSQDTWRIGSDLSIRHPSLTKFISKKGCVSKKEHEIGMTIYRINLTEEKCSVKFRPHPRSYNLFNILIKSKDAFNEDSEFTIGPSEDFAETIANALQSPNFTEFILHSPLFDEWRGVRRSEKVSIDNLTKPFDVNGLPLDPSQTKALRTAIRNPGFTCIEAPPSSGKTFLIAALVGAKYQEVGPEGGSICISSTANSAVTNAMDKTHECSSDIKKVREYSKKAEEEKSKEMSLREMALKAGKYIDLEKHENVRKAIISYYTCKKEFKAAVNLTQRLQALNDLQKAENKLRIEFIIAYQPYVIGTTCELMARMGDVIYSRTTEIENEEERNYLEQYAITHLILDEASQLSPHLALALYVMLPALEQVTLIGDSKQLGPYTPLDERCFAYKLVHKGELDRIGSNITKVYLNTVYRSHPRIVNLLLSPIYGPELRSGLTAKKRNVAQIKGLPIAQDEHKTPVLFVNINNAWVNERGVNETELNVVLDFINTLKEKGVTGEDIAVICNHHAQKEALLSSLKGKGSIGVLNTSVGVYTLDSFQVNSEWQPATDSDYNRLKNQYY